MLNNHQKSKKHLNQFENISLMLEIIKQRIKSGLVGSVVEVLDPRNDGIHLKAIVTWKGFEGKTILEQHRMVNNCIKDLLKEKVHALGLETRVN